MIDLALSHPCAVKVAVAASAAGSAWPFWIRPLAGLRLAALPRVHFARNLLQCVLKAPQGMVTAALRSVFAQETAEEIESRWDDLATSLAERFPKAAAM